jgi:protein-S-isoprenylcysteine O-methyltransferase Ste14
VNWIVIPFEEARLRDTFGQIYVEYCRRVRRWL